MSRGQKGADPRFEPILPALVIAFVLFYALWQISKPWTAEEAQQKITECEDNGLSYIVERHETGLWEGRISDARCVLLDAAPQPENSQPDSGDDD